MITIVKDGDGIEEPRLTASEISEFDARIEAKEKEILRMQSELVRLRQQRPSETVGDYVFLDFNEQKVRLSELFGDKADLIVIHNMGIGCSHCTMWADGFNGVVRHLESRAGFVVISPEPPRVQRAIARSRGWAFKLVSAFGTSFFADLGFADESGQTHPGISALTRNLDGTIERHQRTNFFPQDNFCVVWHMFELLPSGSRNWQPMKPNWADIAGFADC